MINMELSYMNTNHPDFIGFAKYSLLALMCADIVCVVHLLDLPRRVSPPLLETKLFARVGLVSTPAGNAH